MKDRLTWEFKDGGMFVDGSEIKNFICDDVEACTGNAIIRLAEYENTELSPADVILIRKMYDGAVEQIDKLQKECSNLKIINSETNKCIFSREEE